MEQTECSEMAAYKIKKPENYPKENVQHTEQGKSLKSRKAPLGYFIKTLNYCALKNNIIAARVPCLDIIRHIHILYYCNSHFFTIQ
jgi:hypothetical protein